MVEAFCIVIENENVKPAQLQFGQNMTLSTWLQPMSIVISGVYNQFYLGRFFYVFDVCILRSGGNA